MSKSKPARRKTGLASRISAPKRIAVSQFNETAVFCTLPALMYSPRPEMSGYGTARAFAKRLGMTQAANLLQQTLSEEEAADRKLNQIAESAVNPQAASAARA